MGGGTGRQTDRQTDRETYDQNDPENIVQDTQNHHPMCFSLKVMVQNVFLQNGGKYNAPIFGQHADC